MGLRIRAFGANPLDKLVRMSRMPRFSSDSGRKRNRVEGSSETRHRRFQAVLIVFGATALVVVAAWINTWLGVVVFLALVGAAFWAIRGGMRQRLPPAHDDVVREAGVHRILVVANETVGGDELHDLLGRKAEACARTSSSSARR